MAPRGSARGALTTTNAHVWFAPWISTQGRPYASGAFGRRFVVSENHEHHAILTDRREGAGEKRCSILDRRGTPDFRPKKTRVLLRDTSRDADTRVSSRLAPPTDHQYHADNGSVTNYSPSVRARLQRQRQRRREPGGRRRGNSIPHRRAAPPYARCRG